MTQAFNLSLFANKLNTSGATDNTGLQNSSVTVTAGTGLSGGGSVALGSSVTLNVGTVPIANGGTGQTTAANAINALVPSQTSQSGKVLTTNGSTVSWGTGGTVSSVATGNGLSGGTITTTGTLIIACPSFNSVGSYVYGVVSDLYPVGVNSGSNYSAGTGYSQIATYATGDAGGGFGTNNYLANNLSGTWKWMGANTTNGGNAQAVCCRVS
jgi:hypothetical protein